MMIMANRYIEALLVKLFVWQVNRILVVKVHSYVGGGGSWRLGGASFYLPFESEQSP